MWASPPAVCPVDLVVWVGLELLSPVRVLPSVLQCPGVLAGDAMLCYLVAGQGILKASSSWALYPWGKSASLQPQKEGELAPYPALPAAHQ